MRSVTAPTPSASWSRPASPEAAEAAFGVYVHWPFCLSKCPYCDFNSHVRETIDQDRWRAALLADLDHEAERTPGRQVTSVFFGGGTPSLMAPATVAAVIERIDRRWGLAADAEITAEANPTSVERARLADIRDAGVNRVSLGVQALDNDALRFLGRGHDAAEALAAVATAARLFRRYSIDLIYARPGQSPAAWRAELERALSHVGDHISVYQLTIEQGTVFHGLWRQGSLEPPDADTGAALYDVTQEMLEAAGLPAYEISNHAAPGGECRHNLLYWRYGEYVGIGPGAHGRVSRDGTKLATQRRRLPERWLEAVERDGHGIRGELPLSVGDRLVEMVLMGLRTREGIPAERFLREAGAPMAQLVDGEALADFIAEGWLTADAAGLRASPEGHARLDAIIDRLLR